MKNLTLGEKIKKIRVNRNKTQQETAEYMGVSRPYYAQWENNTKNINAHQLMKLAKYFQVTLDYFSESSDDEIFFTLLTRLSNFFENEQIPAPDKDKAYQDIMRAYLKSKENISNNVYNDTKTATLDTSPSRKQD